MRAPKGVVIVAAAGNSGLSRAATPANCTGVVAVGAVDQNDARPSWSNAGSGVVLAAPGVSIGSPINPDINGGALYGLGTGTSIASPHVAGVAALLWASSYGTSAEAVINRLESTADHIAGTGSLWTYGRVDALKAVGAPRRAATATPTAVPGHRSPPPTQAPATSTGIPTRSPRLSASTRSPPPQLPTSTRVPPGAPVAPTPKLDVGRRPLRSARVDRHAQSCHGDADGGQADRANQRERDARRHGQVQVSWQASVDSRTTFNVYRGDANGLDMRLLRAGVPSSTQVFVDRSAPVGQFATYAVAAQNAAGEGPHSAPARTAAIIR